MSVTRRDAGWFGLMEGHESMAFKGVGVLKAGGGRRKILGTAIRSKDDNSAPPGTQV